MSFFRVPLFLFLMVLGGEVEGTDEGKVFAFGLNDCGQLAQPLTVSFSQVPSGICYIASDSALTFHLKFLFMSSRHLLQWGICRRLKVSQLDTTTPLPSQVQYGTKTTGCIACSVLTLMMHPPMRVVGTEDGHVYVWGANGQVGRSEQRHCYPLY